jgi:hypothetical protein
VKECPQAKMPFSLPLKRVERGAPVMKRWIGLTFVLALLISVHSGCNGFPEFVKVDPSRHTLYNDPISDEEMMGIGP